MFRFACHLPLVAIILLFKFIRYPLRYTFCVLHALDDHQNETEQKEERKKSNRAAAQFNKHFTNDNNVETQTPPDPSADPFR